MACAWMFCKERVRAEAMFSSPQFGQTPLKQAAFPPLLPHDEHDHPWVAPRNVQQAEVDDKDEGASTRPHGQSPIEFIVQESYVAANHMVENCKDRLFCSPDCCATPKETTGDLLFSDVSRRSRGIRGDQQLVLARRGANCPTRSARPTDVRRIS